MSVCRFVTVVLIALAASARSASMVKAQNAPLGSVEEVYIFRSIRTVRVVGPDAAEFCRSRVAFTSFAKDTSDLVSITVGPNGLVTEPKVKVIGKLVTCTGRTTN